MTFGVHSCSPCLAKENHASLCFVWWCSRWSLARLWRGEASNHSSCTRLPSQPRGAPPSSRCKPCLPLTSRPKTCQQFRSEQRVPRPFPINQQHGPPSAPSPPPAARGSQRGAWVCVSDCMMRGTDHASRLGEQSSAPHAQPATPAPLLTSSWLVLLQGTVWLSATPLLLSPAWQEPLPR